MASSQQDQIRGFREVAIAHREHTETDPAAATSLLRTASWLIDTAAAAIADAGARLGLSDPDWTEFLERLPEPAVDERGFTDGAGSR